MKDISQGPFAGSQEDECLDGDGQEVSGSGWPEGVVGWVVGDEDRGELFGHRGGGDVLCGIPRDTASVTGVNQETITLDGHSGEHFHDLAFRVVDDTAPIGAGFDVADNGAQEQTQDKSLRTAC